MRTIYFIRHGQTGWNAEGRLQGAHDIDLNAVGEEQAASVAPRLAAVAGPALAQAEFVASPLLRTRRTMEIMRANLGLPPGDYRIDPRLREIGFGGWEGATWAEVRRRDPAGAGQRDRMRWQHRPPGQGGESYAMLKERVAPVFAELGPVTVVVAHGGVARAMLVALEQLDTYAAPRLGIRQGEVLVVDGQGWRWA
ncbi:histidine phosphatase family protein [Methylobacterium sp. J-076]|uniref:histidine phosphatase family protein n=1 Tax=Methylobacterium sp. J-076 TaxID=2836655 RepID=UPI001FB99073|nr:histidine phosphatase family protein [Methylobacterium sp. J-076]MCJ2011067.1 histidine phosphatase family protein [Methylobacterium sp. J-076]